MNGRFWGSTCLYARAFLQCLEDSYNSSPFLSVGSYFFRFHWEKTLKTTKKIWKLFIVIESSISRLPCNVSSLLPSSAVLVGALLLVGWILELCCLFFSSLFSDFCLITDQSTHPKYKHHLGNLTKNSAYKIPDNQQSVTESKGVNGE